MKLVPSPLYESKAQGGVFPPSFVACERRIESSVTSSFRSSQTWLVQFPFFSLGIPFDEGPYRTEPYRTCREIELFFSLPSSKHVSFSGLLPNRSLEPSQPCLDLDTCHFPFLVAHTSTFPRGPCCKVPSLVVHVFVLVFVLVWLNTLACPT
jgi:hypothetical protein